MTKLPIIIDEYRNSLAGLAAAVALGVMTTVAATTPSTAQVAGMPSDVAEHRLVENVAYVARRGVVVGRGYRGGYRGAYIGRDGYRGRYAYRRGYGYGVGAGVAGAAAGAAILGGALDAPYYAAPYPYYAPPIPLGIDPGIRDNPEEDYVEPKFEPEENVYGSGAVAVVGIAASFVVSKIATTWTVAPSGEVQDFAASGVQGSDQTSAPESRTSTPIEEPNPLASQLIVGQVSGRTSAPSAPTGTLAKPRAPQLIVWQGSPGGTDEALPMNVSLISAPADAMIAIYGLTSGSTLNVGRVSGTNGWRLMAADLRIALVRPPQGFVGAMQLGLELRLADESVADLKTLRLEWLAPAPAAAVIAPPAPAVAPAPAAAVIAPPAPAVAAAPAAAVTATPAPAVAAAPAAAVAQAPKPGFIIRHLDPNEAAALVKRGEEFIASGDLASARLVLQRAAEAGEAQAALSLAGTYDPIVLEKLGFKGPTADIEKARMWYERAQEFGSPNASGRLQSLASRDH